ncbi:protein kinase [Streptomyces sp. NPDC005863]|uniref:serine/threonine-protein kinase n=1 Tax=Streptomyces sp. NPDC005863 TaxID=3364735 RepID=UPI003686A51E
MGSGGMGTVYLARSRGGRAVAVKVARAELAGDPHFRARFRAEVEAARKVGGFHTAQVVDADPEAVAPWLATAYIPGSTLSELVATRGPMDEAQLRLLGAALAEALQAVHACGLVHRDLKPGNIVMADDGPRVLDFGIAHAVESTRLTSTGMAFGTPGFLAPEQAQGLKVGSAADVFALGAVLVAAAGGSAFGSGTPMGLMYRSVHEEADLSAVPQGVRAVVAACLAKDPAGRPTPEALLDLFTPEPTEETHPPTRRVPAAQGAPGARGGPVGRAEPDGSNATPGPANSPTATADAVAAPDPGGVASAQTVAATPRGKASTRGPAARPMPPGLLAAVVTGALVLFGGAVYAAYVFKDSGPSFPTAQYKLEPPATLLGGAYELKEGTLSAPSKKLYDDEDRKDAREFRATYTGKAKAGAFQELKVDGVYGRLKNSEVQREDMVSSSIVTNEEKVVAPLKEIRVAGADVVFSCETATSRSYGTKTVCAWADENTAGSVQFKPHASLERAAAETRKIRDDMRKRIEG